MGFISRRHEHFPGVSSHRLETHKFSMDSRDFIRPIMPLLLHYIYKCHPSFFFFEAKTPLFLIVIASPLS